MTTRKTSLLAVATIMLLTTSLLAHEVTYKGTVVAIGAANAKGETPIQVSVVDEKTKKPVTKSFDIDKETKILRGEKRVTMAEARIEKNEKIAVTIDHDADETLAIVIKLDPRK